MGALMLKPAVSYEGNLVDDHEVCGELEQLRLSGVEPLLDVVRIQAHALERGEPLLCGRACVWLC